MIFVYRKWEEICRKLKEKGLQSIPACEVKSDSGNYVVLKHDVETDVQRAHKIAQIEKEYGHGGSYYVQAYLLSNNKNVELLSEMQQMGHEVSYHYDVLDYCKGNMEEADVEFEKNLNLFRSKGLRVVTVCQHGNPIIERNGYSSNRDFFRNSSIRAKYTDIADIMVNFKEKFSTDYLYFSDAGRMFKLIYDPINNDVINSDDKNIPFNSVDELLNGLDNEIGNIISIHPHRWMQSATFYLCKKCIFKVLKTVAKIMAKIPVFNRLMSKYYYLAKKI